MSNIAIQVEDLSKRYRIGRRQGQASYGSLRETLADAASSPIRRLRNSGNSDPQTKPDFIWALKDVSFEVKTGEVVGIIGRNGAGKTTLLKVLSRITRPTKGNVRLWGRVGSLLEVGTGFHPELTGRENIYLNGAVLGMKRIEIERKFDEIIDFAEIEQFLDTPVKRYSSGMYMRLAFAVAAHLEPEILLVDEVLAVGDAAFQKKCLGKMGEVAREGRTVLFISHNLSAIEGLCNECIFLDAGIVRSKGKTKNIVLEYIESYSNSIVGPKPGIFDLTERKNNYSINQIYIQKVILRNSKGEICNRFSMGKPLTIEIKIQDLNEIKYPIIGITIKTLKGDWIGSFNTSMVGYQFEPNIMNETWAVCNLTELPFNPGSYVIAVSVVDMRIKDRVDYASSAAFFDVIEQDIYGYGYPMESKYGVVFLKGNWHLRN